MQQRFGVINHYIQDEGCGHDIICALWPVNSGENTGQFSLSLAVVDTNKKNHYLKKCYKFHKLL